MGKKRMADLVITQSITNREADSLRLYFSDIGKEGLIDSKTEEADLVRKIRGGDIQAFEKLIKGNLKFVVSVAKQYQNQGLSLPDLINEGNIGLIKAVKKFDETRGHKFISYAVWWIRQSILQALAETSRTIRIPLNQLGSLSKIRKGTQKLEQELGRPPTLAEISELLGIQEERILETILGLQKHISIDAPFNQNEDSGNMLDVMTYDDTSKETDWMLTSNALKKEIANALSNLSEQDADIIRLSFGIGLPQGLTLKEIGKKLNLTHETIRNKKDKALRRLRIGPKSNSLKSYLD